MPAITELTTVEPAEVPQVVGFNIEALISRAIDNQTGVETMEKLLAMRRELRLEFALEQFNRSMSVFQAECPEIKKTIPVRNSKEKGGGVRYKYAPLDAIICQVKGIIRDHGFSYLIKTIQAEKTFTAICIVNHVDGHSVETSFTVPVDFSARMSDQQKVASASTYSKRYAFCNAFGIMTADEDNDGAGDTSKLPKAKPPVHKSKGEFAVQAMDLAELKAEMKRLLFTQGFPECFRQVFEGHIGNQQVSAQAMVAAITAVKKQMTEVKKKPDMYEEVAEKFDDQDIPF